MAEGPWGACGGAVLNEPQPVGGLFKGIVERAIVNCADPAERKRRILIARETGVFSESEAIDWLRLLGLEAA